MKPEPVDASAASPAKSGSLGRVLGRSRKIKVAIKKAAGRLTSANAVLKQGKRADVPARAVEQAITQYENVESEVAQAAHDLSQVNTALAVEVAEREGIESELADAKADLAGAKDDLATAHDDLATAHEDLATVHDDLSESQASEQEAIHLSLHDGLTGLPNRALFDQGLDQGLIQARRHSRGLAVLFIDLDEFKDINDSYGHHIGDEVLLMIAQRLRSFVRAEDMISRWGGDEFVCLLLEVDDQAAVVRLARDMVDRIAEEFQSGGTTFSVGCSIGIALYPQDGESADTLLKRADEAMYQAKGSAEKVALFGDLPRG